MKKLLLSYILPAALITPWTSLVYSSVSALNHWYIIYPINGLLVLLFRNIMISTFGTEVTFQSTLVTMTKEQWEAHKRDHHEN